MTEPVKIHALPPELVPVTPAFGHTGNWYARSLVAASLLPKALFTQLATRQGHPLLTVRETGLNDKGQRVLAYTRYKTANNTFTLTYAEATGSQKYRPLHIIYGKLQDNFALLASEQAGPDETYANVFSRTSSADYYKLALQLARLRRTGPHIQVLPR